MPLMQKIALGLLCAALIFAGSLFYRMVEEMSAMTGLMAQMAEDIATMSGDIHSMNREFRKVGEEVATLRGSVEKMERHMGKMEQPFTQAPEQLQKVVPMPSMNPFSGRP